MRVSTCDPVCGLLRETWRIGGARQRFIQPVSNLGLVPLERLQAFVQRKHRRDDAKVLRGVQNRLSRLRVFLAFWNGFFQK